MNGLRRLASLRLTAVAMAALALGILVTYRDAAVSTLWVALPLSVLASNLLAALIVDPRFRRQPPLLVFHLCLLALLALGAASRLVTLSARVELIEGGAFSAAEVEVVSAGALHPFDRLEHVAFHQGPVRVAYAERLIRVETASRLVLPERAGAVDVGDNVPLVIDGYRFYTTANKGFAAIVTWRDDAGGFQAGAIHFPSYPRNDWKQLNTWVTPAGQRVELELALPAGPSANAPWTLESASARAAPLRVGVAGAAPVELRAGEAVALRGGVLRFDAVRLWMGYEIFYDPFLAWLFATALVGATALAWHFHAKLARTAPTRLRGGAHDGVSASV